MSKPAAAPIRIATRGSALALAQAQIILAECRRVLPGHAAELLVLKTTGDKLQTASLVSGSLPKGLFTKELEVALLEGEADVAVHSLKDLPTELPAGLALGAVTARVDVRDVLICRAAATTARDMRSLPAGAVVGTSSTRRSAQLLAHRPDLRAVPIRGNVGTRLRKLAEGDDLHAILLAAAGLERLGFTTSADGTLSGPPDAALPPGLIATPIAPEEMLPAPGQAALGLEVRANDPQTAGVCALLNDPVTHACVAAERAFLRTMGGGCQLAVAAYAVAEGQTLWLRALSFLSGAARHAEGRGPITDPERLGAQLAAELQG